MRAILMFHKLRGQSHKTVSTDYNFWRERRAEVDSNQGPSAYQLSAFARPNWLTGKFGIPALKQARPEA